jgi:predicted RNase H-like nuclease (RuvC/YqgF family)
MNLPSNQQTGFMAEDMHELFPELVKRAMVPSPSQESIDAGLAKYADAVEFDAVNYTGLIPHLTRSIQEQQDMINEKDERINDLESSNMELKAAIIELRLRLDQMEEQVNKHLKP